MPKGNPNPITPLGIEDIGLKSYLNSTAHAHNGVNYSAFCKLVKTTPSRAEVARIMGVNRRTLKKWILIHEGAAQ